MDTPLVRLLPTQAQPGAQRGDSGALDRVDQALAPLATTPALLRVLGAEAPGLPWRLEATPA
eukprot:7136449-Heterocapsa_arctica.AAC.1